MSQEAMHEYTVTEYWTLIIEYGLVDAEATKWGWWWTLGGGFDLRMGGYAKHLGRWHYELDPTAVAFEHEMAGQLYATEQAAIIAAMLALAYLVGVIAEPTALQ